MWSNETSHLISYLNQLHLFLYIFTASIFCCFFFANTCHLICVKIPLVSQFRVNSLNPLLVWLASLLTYLREIVVRCTGLEEDLLAFFRFLFLFLVSLSLLLPCWSISAITLVASVNLVSLNHLCQQMLRILTGCYNINTAFTCQATYWFGKFI